MHAPALVFVGIDGLSAGLEPSHLDGVRAALGRLEQMGVPVVLWSGTSRAEIEWLRARLNVRGPFVSEHGAALFLPGGGAATAGTPSTRTVAGYDVVEFAWPYAQVAAIVRRVAEAVGVAIATLGDMSIDEASQILAVPLLQARLAKLREYVESFLVMDRAPERRTRLLRALQAAGLTTWRAAPFDAAAGLGDPCQALDTARRLLSGGRDRIMTVGVGSRVEDLPMLKTAARRILVGGSDPAAAAELASQVAGAETMVPGPPGWMAALDRAANYVAPSAERLPSR